MKLAGKVALVTGTSPNIGGAIAEALAEEGAKVVCVDRNDAYAAACAQGIRANGGEAIGIACDVTDEALVSKLIGQATETFGGIDIVVNAAVAYNTKGVLDMPLSEWERQLSVILTGTFLVTKYSAKSMIAQKRKGSIINIASTAAHQGEPGNVGYCTCKSGLLNFTRSVAMELAEYGIRVNTLTPTATDMAEARERAARWQVPWDRPPRNPHPGLLATTRTGSPLRALPSARHYGRAAVFLASDDAEMITAEDLRVDAGTVARYWRWQPSPDET